MPIYEYRRPDGTTFEIQQSFSDETLTHDPETGVEVKRVLHAPAVHFKGKGFYNTDYGTRKRQRENAANAEGSSSGRAPRRRATPRPRTPHLLRLHVLGELLHSTKSGLRRQSESKDEGRATKPKARRRKPVVVAPERRSPAGA